MTTREKRMLGGCLAVLLVSGTTIVAKEFLDRRFVVETKIAGLESQIKESQAWLADRAFQEKRRDWLEKIMPATDSLVRAQGMLLEDMQNDVLDRGVKIERTTLNDATSTPHYREVTVNMILRGDQAILLEWLAGLQSPEFFQIIKTLEIDPDTKSKEKLPQVEVNLTVARWFKPA
ncbi:MAG: hypothetical protein ACOYOF_13725 [Verrucomicrobiaceae bacterium]|jgi:hypothetical protein